MLERKAFLGHKLRRLRRSLGLTQAQMAEQLQISPSYLNLMEHNQRPLTVPLLLRLGQTFQVDLKDLAEDEEAETAQALRDVFSDPLFADAQLRLQDVDELAAIGPSLAQAIIQLHRAWRQARDDVDRLAEKLAGAEQDNGLPVEAVRDFFHGADNHFPSLEDEAEAIRAGGEPGRLAEALARRLEERHGLVPRVLPVEVMGSTIRRLDRHSRRVLLSELLPAPARIFQLGVQLAILEAEGAIGQLVDKARLERPEAQRLARFGLANYVAGAIMMPYGRFRAAAEALRWDLDLLAARFEASFEQVCHRLTTLQRPGEAGIPFFMLRVDKAGNVSKRFSAAAAFPFARSGGSCPLWIVWDAFRQPERILTQAAALPDGTVWFTIARALSHGAGPWGAPAQEFALGLGCAAEHAGRLIYARGVDLVSPEALTPIGPACRLCPRLDCAQRAAPALNQRMTIDEHLRGWSPYR